MLLSGWYFPLPFGVLIYGLFWLNLRPEEAALWGGLTLMACGIGFGYRGKRLGVTQIVTALRETGIACVEIMMITAAAGLVIGILNLTGLGFALTATLVNLAEGSPAGAAVDGGGCMHRARYGHADAGGLRAVGHPGSAGASSGRRR